MAPLRSGQQAACGWPGRAAVVAAGPSVLLLGYVSRAEGCLRACAGVVGVNSGPRGGFTWNGGGGRGRCWGAVGAGVVGAGPAAERGGRGWSL